MIFGRYISLTVVVFTIVSTRAQNPRGKASGSPFQPRAKQEYQKVPKQSERTSNTDFNGRKPFSPPRDSATTRRIETTTTMTTAAVDVVVAEKEAEKSPDDPSPPKLGSPFTPPPQREWRDSSQQEVKPRPKSSNWLHSLEERQRENANDIPPVANIDVSNDPSHDDDDDDDKSSNNNRKSLKRGGGGSSSKLRTRSRPRVSTYQDNFQHRDMHDVGPGVTPWTRYTQKPRLSDESADSGPGKVSARCGRVRYSPRNQICCDGRVARRRGMSPACCGTESYDNVFSKCCNGVISFRSDSEAEC